MSDAINSFKDLKDFASSDAFEAKLKSVYEQWDKPSAGKDIREHRKELLLDLANSSLKAQGIPELRGTYEVKGRTDSSYHFSFSPTATQPQNDWTLGIDARLLSMDAKQIAEEVEFGRVGGLVYHEIRHAQQFYWMAVDRSRNTQSPLPPNVPANTKRLPPEIEAGVPSFIMAEARSDARQFTPAQQQLVQQLYAENNPYPDRVDDKNGNSPRERTQRTSAAGGRDYFRLAREKDAYDAHRYIRQSQNMTRIYNDVAQWPEAQKLQPLKRPLKKSEAPSPAFVSELSNDSPPRINVQQRLAELYRELGVTTSADGIPRTTLGDPEEWAEQSRANYEQLSRALAEFGDAVSQIPPLIEPIPARDFKLVRLYGAESRSLESESGSFEQVLAERWRNSIQSSLQRQAEQQEQGDDSGLDLGALGE
jgi:hypothetical protein